MVSRKASMYLLYCPVSNAEEAQTLATILVREKWALCCNIVAEVQSIYLWENKVQSDCESVLWVKVEDDRWDMTIKRIEALHTYQTPVILVIKIEMVNPKYTHYLDSQMPLYTSTQDK